MERHLDVAVSGLGAVSGFGWGVEALWEGLRSGRTGLGAFDVFDHSRHRTHLAAQVPPPPERFARAVPGWRRLSVADRFALFAACEALERAGLDAPYRRRPGSAAGGAQTRPEGSDSCAPSSRDPADADDALLVGVYFGSSTGGMLEGERFFERFLAERVRGVRVSPLVSQQVNGPGDAIARHLGVTGPVETVSSACASASLALGAALDAVRSGEVDVALAGGSDSLCQLTYAGFNALRSVDEGPCRPFRGGRQGMSFGEGAAVLVLEPIERVLARGGEPLAVLAGAGASCDAHHMTAPDPQGLGASAAMAAALADAGLPPEAVDFVNAHATGTPLNDLAEWRALARVFGERAERIPVTATKGIVGHLLGSAGAIEAAATVLCLREGEVHPTPGGGEIDPESPVDLVLDRPRPLPGARVALSTNLAFGGSNAALVFSRWTDGAARALSS